MKQGDPPPDLQKRSWCREWGVLPRAGGLDDQRYIELWRMHYLDHIYGVVSRWRRAKMTGDDAKVIGWLAAEGYLKNKD